MSLSPAPVRRRIERLERIGVIAGYTVMLDHRTLGGSLEAFTELRFAGDADIDHIVATAKAIPEVVELFTTAGDPDALARIRVSDVGELSDVITAVPQVEILSTRRSCGRSGCAASCGSGAAAAAGAGGDAPPPRHSPRPFGYAHVRRVERQLPDEYRRLVESAVARLEPDSAELVAKIAALPDLVRGYEEIKLGNVERFRARATELEDQLAEGPRTIPSSSSAVRA